jgi:tripartite-type tricarboxylate transporter receptor subunit TctC
MVIIGIIRKEGAPMRLRTTFAAVALAATAVLGMAGAAAAGGDDDNTVISKLTYGPGSAVDTFNRGTNNSSTNIDFG